MSKRAGAVPEETKEWILNAAREEFLKYGFAGSSLRRICSAAGVTTGAMYFFFKNKDDLFETVISKVTEPFNALLLNHYNKEINSDFNTDEGKDEDFEVSRLLIELYFSDRETWDILLHHLNHHFVRDFLDSFVEISTEHYINLLKKQNILLENLNIDRFDIHQYVHMQVDAMLTLISHGFTKDEMIRHAQTVIKMLRGAFYVLLNKE